MYVAGFERGVRPIGFWSISITLSKTSMPSTPRARPGLTRARLSRFASALKTISFTSVDLPEPETPVTQMNLPTGNSTSISFRLCCVAPLTQERAAILVAPLGHRDRARAREELARDRLLVPLDLRRRPFRDDLAAVQAGARAPCRRASRSGASSPRRARRRAPCCRCRAAARACRSAARCRAGGGRSTARRGCRARRRAASRSASRAAAAAPRRPRASPPRGRA